jgi:hypothetical protein
MAPPFPALSATPMFDETMDACEGDSSFDAEPGLRSSLRNCVALGPSVGRDEGESSVGVGVGSGGPCMLPEGKVEGGA